LNHHGLLTVANTVEAAVFWYIALEEPCQRALASLAAVGSDARRLLLVKDESAAM
jgi:ribulose-5-phosphate 4-epimerase/fuculose-1-phosphate aldolase